MTVSEAVRNDGHRPWPCPKRPWIMLQTWHDLLFAHWPIEPAVLRPRIPIGLTLDTFDGRAWLGVVPFRMSGIRARWVPPIPGHSAFPELNVRTYVIRDGKPGVHFFSLDAANALAVAVARRCFHLPYFNATMETSSDKEVVSYNSVRTHRESPIGEFHGTYGASGPVALARPGTLEHWLTERYCLYCHDRQGRPFRGEIQHQPWPLQTAWASIETNTMASAAGIELPDLPPVCHFARRLEVVFWGYEPLDRCNREATT